MSGIRRGAWLALLLVAAVFLSLYLADLGVATDAVAFAGVAMVTMAGLLAGPVLHRPQDRVPWVVFTAAAFFFLIGVLSRPWSEAQSGVLVILTDALTLTGYVLMAIALVRVARGGDRMDRYACVDGSIVTLGMGAVALVIFALPAATLPGRSVASSLALSLYPVVDIALIFLLLHIGFTTAGSLVTYRFLGLGVVSLLIGDVGYGWVGAHGLDAPRLMDVPFMVTYALVGAAALHPSMAGMSTFTVRPVQAWSARRLGLLLPSLMAPALLLITVRGLGTAEHIVVALASACTMGLLLWRAIAAVHGYAGAQAVLRHQSMHDSLTGLPNRRQLILALRDALGRRGLNDAPLWLIALDLDGFRFVNDGWGHSTGDQLLAEVANRIRDVLPKNALLARTGGDEFAVLHRGHEGDALELATVLRDLLRTPVEVDGMDFVVTVSLGLASCVDRGSAVELMRDADTAMCRAKAEGRDRWVVFGDDMRERVRDRMELELALRHALIRDQFSVAYQPIVDMVDERVLGCEALLRWRHPVRGNVPPGEFIPVAEETGLVVELGAWVLGEATRCVAGWQRAGVVGPEFVLSVNISPRQLAEGGLPETVAAVLQESGLPAACLCLEITESVMLVQPEVTVEALRVLRSMGVKLAVDDFGTGYSSLSYLSMLPVSGVKLDRAFVERLDQEQRDDAIVRAVHALAGALELDLIAEGIETCQQRGALRALGVSMGQGWLWGAAVSPEEFASRFGESLRLAGGTHATRGLPRLGEMGNGLG